VFVESLLIVLLLCFTTIQLFRTRQRSDNTKRFDSEFPDGRTRIAFLDKQLRDSQLQVKSLQASAEHAPPKIDIFNVTNGSSARDRDDWLVEWDVSDSDKVEVYLGGELVSQENSGSIHRTLRVPTWVKIKVIGGLHTVEKERFIGPVAALPGRTAGKGDDQKQ
jgi:hypothetical protein